MLTLTGTDHDMCDPNQVFERTIQSQSCLEVMRAPRPWEMVLGFFKGLLNPFTGTEENMCKLPPKDTPSSQRSQIAKPAPGSVSTRAKRAAKNRTAEQPSKDTPRSQRSQIAKPAPGSVSRRAKQAAKKRTSELPPKDSPSSQRSQIAKPAPGSVSRGAKHAAKRTRQKLERNPTSGAKHASEPIPSADKQPGCKSLQAGVKS